MFGRSQSDVSLAKATKSESGFIVVPASNVGITALGSLLF